MSSSDFELKTTLTADGGQLADAMRKAEKDTQAYTKAATDGSGAATAAMNANTAALAALTQAMSRVNKEAKDYVQASQSSADAAKRDAAAQRESAQATQAVAEARSQFISGLRDQIALYGKSTEEVLRYRAAQAGVGAEASPLILQFQHQRAAQAAAAEAAKREADAQREAAQAKQSAAAAQSSFLTGLREQVALQGKTGGDVLRYRATQLGVGPEAAKYIDQYEAAMRKSGVTAGQTAQAMRMLPAQITDITTSLASGMPVWMVAIQQGGQIKDSFGGIGPAFRAVTGAISPMVLGLTAGAAAAGALAYAYNRGSAEADAYVHAIVLTGNAAGVTAGQLDQMAGKVSQTVGTQAAAAEALATVVGGGLITQNIEQIGIAALQMERLTGKAVKDTVAEYEQLAKKPLEASVKLNETQHYLTLAQYQQIAALEKKGQVAQAASVAQQAYLDAETKRTKELEGQLGTLQRLWEGITKTVKEAGSAMLSIGRPDTTEEEIKSLRSTMAERNAKGPLNSATTDSFEEGNRRNEAKLAKLEAKLAAERATASSQADQVSAADAAIKTAEDARKKEGASANNARQEAEARSKAGVEALKADLAGLTDAYSGAERVMAAQRAAGLLSEGEYWDAKRAFIKLNEAAQLGALAQENELLASQRVSGVERIRRDADIAKNKAEMAKVQAKAVVDTVTANIEEEASIKRLQRAHQDYLNTLQETANARARRHGREIATLGRGDEARSLAGRQNDLEDTFLNQRQSLDADKQAGRIDRSEHSARLAALKASYDTAVALEVTYQEQRRTAQENGSLGMTRALENYLDGARNVAAQTEQLFTNAFKGMEDGIVQFAMTGKMNFKSFAESVISDLIRIYVRQQMVGMLNSLAASMGGGSSSSYSLSGSGASLGESGGGGFWGDVKLGGPKAAGGSVYPGTLHPVNELGPEVLTIDDRDYLMMGSRGGHVTPNDRSLMPLSARPAAAAASGNGAVNITMPLNVINNTGTPVQASSQQRSDGGFDLIIEAIETTIAGNVSAGAGPLSRAVEGRYGLQPTFA